MSKGKPRPVSENGNRHDEIDWNARCKQCGKRVEWKKDRYVCECMREIHNDTRLGQ